MLNNLKCKLKGIYEGVLILIGLAIIICFIFINRQKNNARSSRKGCRLFFCFSGIRLEQIGDFDESADLIIMNHQSVADILCLEAYHPRNICWVAKKQLGEIPFYGYALNGPEMILIDRENKKGLAFLLKSVKEKLAQNRPIVIFPEGTRGRGKEKFLPFKPGAIIIAERFSLKIQPIVLINTRKIYNTSPMEATSNVARMVCLEPFTIGEMPKARIFKKAESLDSLDSLDSGVESKAGGDSGNKCAKRVGLVQIQGEALDARDASAHDLDSSQNAESQNAESKGAESKKVDSKNLDSNQSANVESKNTESTKADSNDWYGTLASLMQEVHLYHYKQLNKDK